MHSARTEKLIRAAVLVLLVVLGAAFLSPFAWMVSTSLKPLGETMSLPPRWIPSTIQWHNYPDAIAAMGYFWRYAGNSLYLCVLTVVGTVLEQRAGGVRIFAGRVEGDATNCSWCCWRR